MPWISLMMLKLPHKEAMQHKIKKGKNKTVDISTDFYDMPQQQSGMWVVAYYCTLTPMTLDLISIKRQCTGKKCMAVESII